MLLRCGTAAEIPLEDASTDVMVAGLVPNFVPDGHAALSEMARVMVAGDTLGAYVRDYAEKMELMRHFWDAAIELNPAAARMVEGSRFPICRPQALSELFVGAGLCTIEVTAVDITTHFDSFDDHWRPFFGDQGPAPAYAMALDETARAYEISYGSASRYERTVPSR